MSPLIFISYRRKGARETAATLAHHLGDIFGKDAVFWDERISPGEDFLVDIEKNISKCRVLLALIDKDWIRPSGGSDFVRREIELAFRCGIKIIPVVLYSAQIPEEAPGVPEWISRLSKNQAFHLPDISKPGAADQAGVLAKKIDPYLSFFDKFQHRSLTKFEIWLSIFILLAMMFAGISQSSLSLPATSSQIPQIPTGASDPPSSVPPKVVGPPMKIPNPRASDNKIAPITFPQIPKNSTESQLRITLSPSCGRGPLNKDLLKSSIGDLSTFSKELKVYISGGFGRNVNQGLGNGVTSSIGFSICRGEMGCPDAPTDCSLICSFQKKESYDDNLKEANSWLSDGILKQLEVAQRSDNPITGTISCD
jgi:hypothetical protein